MFVMHTLQHYMIVHTWNTLRTGTGSWFPPRGRKQNVNMLIVQSYNDDIHFSCDLGAIVVPSCVQYDVCKCSSSCYNIVTYEYHHMISMLVMNTLQGRTHMECAKEGHAELTSSPRSYTQYMHVDYTMLQWRYTFLMWSQGHLGSIAGPVWCL